MLILNIEINACITFKSVWRVLARAPFPSYPVTKKIDNVPNFYLKLQEKKSEYSILHSIN